MADVEDGLKPEDVTKRLESLQRRIEDLGLLNQGQAHSLLHGRDAGALSSERSLALVAFDADSIQDQIFASPRPVTIHGASAVLRSWDQDLQRGAADLLGAPAVVLFAGGGQAILLTRKDHATTVQKHLRKEFSRRTRSSPCTTAHVDLSPRELAEGPLAASAQADIHEDVRARVGWSPKQGRGFGGCMALLAARLRIEKGKERSPTFLETATRTARCGECAERPRTGHSERCERCEANRSEGQKVKKNWEQARSFDEVLGEPARGGDGRGESGGNRARHLAFLRMDGAGIGGILEKLSTMAQYAAVSLALRRAFELDEREIEELGAPPGRYQLPIAGGDDLLLIVPARWRKANGTVGNVLSLCLTLMERAESVFTSDALSAVFQHDRASLELVRKVGAGAGVVITSNIPARFCFDYAGDLVRSAKDGITEAPDARSAVDFAVVLGGSPLASSIRELRRLPHNFAELDLSNALRGRVRKTGCPYTPGRFKALLDRAHALSRIPRSSLHGLRNLMEDPQTGLIEVRYRITRHPELRRALVGAGVPLSSLPPEVGPWVLDRPAGGRDADVSWVTPIPDLLDVLRVIGAAREDRG